ncbi:MAG: phytoene/squalene synthase family protein [Myxococcales bacterium]|nr:phytoene/squalene synthase family protein [Myxococcales bacterium]
MRTSEAQARGDAHWKVLAVRARSFRWASIFLNRAQRRKVAALYAFCRAVDDLADAECLASDVRQDLYRLQAALAAEPDGESLWPGSYVWFRDLCVDCGIDFRVVQELLAGMTSDLGVVRLESDRDLVRYCYRAAGTVGLMMCSVLGVRDPRAWRHAIHLGIAMQLTNIARDVREDAEVSRVYLPSERLGMYGVASEDLVRGEADPLAISLVVGDVLDLAEHYYESGDEGMRFLPLRARWAILVASRLYRGIGRRLRRRQQSNPMLGRVVVPWFEKLALVSKATATWLSLTDRSSRTRRTHELRDYLDGLPYAGPDSNLDAPHERLPSHPLDRKKNISPAAVSPIRPSANG